MTIDITDRDKPRPKKLKWETVVILRGDPVDLPDYLPPRVKERWNNRLPACEINAAVVGWDAKNKVDRLKFTFRLGWLEGTEFMPVTFIPGDYGCGEKFRALWMEAETRAKEEYDRIKAKRGGLRATVGDMAEAKR